ncbi:hypothetical protein ACZ90_67205 [Streptomyces albus subsp. albus]|nr:hypothetical protein ACZ90_67205 [Streptomyces albus subsp. albus]
MLVVLSPVACYSCDDAASDRLDSSLHTASQVFMVCLIVPVALLFTVWVLPRQRRFSERRLRAAVCAPLSVPLLWVVFSSMVDWP